jgi:hypothetical protein
MKPTLNAQFRIYLPDGERLTEDKIEKNKAAACRAIARLADIPGGLTIADPATGAATHLGDTLAVLISAFCLTGLAELQRAGKIRINFFNHDEYVDVALAGPRVTLTGDELAPQSFPAPEYIRALLACGQRYVALMRQVWRGQKDRADEIAALEQELAAAQRAPAPDAKPAKPKAAKASPAKRGKKK